MGNRRAYQEAGKEHVRQLASERIGDSRVKEIYNSGRKIRREFYELKLRLERFDKECEEERKHREDK